jgi:hypothetical protein
MEAEAPVARSVELASFGRSPFAMEAKAPAARFLGAAPFVAAVGLLLIAFTDGEFGFVRVRQACGDGLSGTCGGRSGRDAGRRR